MTLVHKTHRKKFKFPISYSLYTPNTALFNIKYNNTICTIFTKIKHVIRITLECHTDFVSKEFLFLINKENRWHLFIWHCRCIIDYCRTSLCVDSVQSNPFEMLYTYSNVFSILQSCSEISPCEMAFRAGVLLLLMSSKHILLEFSWALRTRKSCIKSDQKSMAGDQAQWFVCSLKILWQCCVCRCIVMVQNLWIFCLLRLTFFQSFFRTFKSQGDSTLFFEKDQTEARQ